ncbi:hypothetical protein [Leptospira santarosai]|uniref:hypothetical protein n=1 Tax=Leptospira santarosai TaxID=28183 RepID=UPI000773C6F7|nr:hypothetical protein [Leptospira santarosai]
MGFCVGIVYLNDSETAVLEEDGGDVYYGLVGARELFEIICDHPHRSLEIDDLWIKRPDQSSFSIIKEKVNLMDSNVRIWLKFISIIERNPNAWVDFG